MSHSLNSPKGGYVGFSVSGFRVQGLNSLKSFIEGIPIEIVQGDTRGLDYSSYNCSMLQPKKKVRMQHDRVRGPRVSSLAFVSFMHSFC